MHCDYPGHVPSHRGAPPVPVTDPKYVGPEVLEALRIFWMKS
jgi:hypothetical protein